MGSLCAYESWPTYGLVTALLLVSATAASLIPARRAMSSDPLAVLRHP